MHITILLLLVDLDEANKDNYGKYTNYLHVTDHNIGFLSPYTTQIYIMPLNPSQYSQSWPQSRIGYEWYQGNCQVKHE